jgi:3',5'-cyclic AMP phosphodiesterase CpdA
MFVLAHLSDPHLGPLPRPRLAELAGKRAAGFFNWRRKRHRIHRAEVLARVTADLKAQAADHIAVTGDLVNISLAGEYAPARAWLAALGPPRDVTLVPGNHDAYVRAAAHYPRLHWCEYMCGDDAQPTAFPFVRRRGPLALIGLSTAVPTAAFLATGRLGRDQIEKLAGVLERCRREGLFRVVMIHHPPISTRARHLKRLVDGADFRAALAQHGAELVIHGHDHVHSLIELEGPQRCIPVIGAPSASAAAPVPPGERDCAGYNLYRIEGGSGGWRCEAIWRSLAREGNGIVEIKRMVLMG